jgi:hypothetical protein
MLVGGTKRREQDAAAQRWFHRRLVASSSRSFPWRRMADRRAKATAPGADPPMRDRIIPSGSNGMACKLFRRMELMRRQIEGRAPSCRRAVSSKFQSGAGETAIRVARAANVAL